MLSRAKKQYCDTGGGRGQCGSRRYWRSCWQDDDASESPADVDDAASLSPCTWRSTSRCSSAAGGAYTSSSSSADPVEDSSRSSPVSSVADDARFTAFPRHLQRSRSTVDRAYSPADGRNWLPTQRSAELSPNDDLLDLLQQQDRGPGSYDGSAPAGSCFEGRVGSLRRRRRSTVTPELMQMDRERAAAASPTTMGGVTSSSRTATPDTTPRTSRRRLLPQPDRAADPGLAAAAAGNKEQSSVSAAAAAVSSRYFVPINNEQDQHRGESNSSSRRLPLVVDTAIGGTLASEVMRVRENTAKNNTAFPSHVESCRNDAEVLPVTAASTRRQHCQQFTTSTAIESSVNDDDDVDDDKLFDLPEDERGKPPSRLTFRSSTLPGRWKWNSPNGEPQKIGDRPDCREPWTVEAGAGEAVQRVTEPQVSNSIGSPTSTKPQTPSPSGLSRAEAMKDRFRRLSEMYKNSLEEDNAVMSANTRKVQNNDVGKDTDIQQSTGDTDNTGTEVVGSKETSAWKTSTSVTSDTESLSSCGRDEGFESETATGSVRYGADVSCLESRHADVTASTTEDTATVYSEANLFASSIDSIIQQASPRAFDGHATYSEAAAADDSSSSSLGTPSTDDAVRCGGTAANDDAAKPSSVSNRLSRINHQRAFAERMSAPRRSVTRSPQRRTSASSPSDATSKNGLFTSPMIRRKPRTPASNWPLPPSAADIENRQRSDTDEVNGSAASSRFVRSSVTRTSLPHTGISVRAAASARPTSAKDQKQSLPLTASRRDYRSTSKTREGQTTKPAATGWCPTPAATHVDRNGVQAKPSSAARVFSTPVRFGATTHQTRATSATERPKANDGHSAAPKQTDSAGYSQRQKNQQTTNNGPDVTWDRLSAQRLSERKSVFERLFEKAQHRRHPKQETNGVAAAGPSTGSRQQQDAESQKKLSSKRPGTASTISARQSINNDA